MGNKDRYFEIILSNGENYLFDIDRNFYVRAIKDAPEEDWKTALAHHIPSIPEGTEVKVVGRLDNFYGRWLEVIYQDRVYSVNPNYFEYIGVKD